MLDLTTEQGSSEILLPGSLFCALQRGLSALGLVVLNSSWVFPAVVGIRGSQTPLCYSGLLSKNSGRPR